MKIKQIVEALVSHEMTKSDAIAKLEQIARDRSISGIEMVVTKVAHTVPNNHGVLEVQSPYRGDAVKDGFSIGDKVTVTPNP